MSYDPTAFKISFDPRERVMRGVAIHGDTPFEVPFATQIAHNLWQGGCEGGLVLPDQIKHLVSLYPWEQYQVRHELESSVTVRMYDSAGGAHWPQIQALGGWVNVCRKTGPVLVHCQAGLNRSSLVVAAALVAGGDVANGAEAIELIRTQRSPACLCNESFERMVKENLA
jgi:protein-tyrosine phosphatase